MDFKIKLHIKQQTNKQQTKQTTNKKTNKQKTRNKYNEHVLKHQVNKLVSSANGLSVIFLVVKKHTRQSD